MSMGHLNIYLAGTIHDPRIASGALPAALASVEPFRVVSTWHRPDAWRPGGDVPEQARVAEVARCCYAELAVADVVVFAVHPGHHARGAHTEIGYAFGRGLPVIVLGSWRDVNTMALNPHAVFVDCTEEALCYLRTLRA